MRFLAKLQSLLWALAQDRGQVSRCLKDPPAPTWCPHSGVRQRRRGKTRSTQAPEGRALRRHGSGRLRRLAAPRGPRCGFEALGAPWGLAPDARSTLLPASAPPDWQAGHWGPWMHHPTYIHCRHAVDREPRWPLCSWSPGGPGVRRAHTSTGTGAGSGGPYCRGYGLGEGAAGRPAGVTGPSPLPAQPPWGLRSWTLLGGGLWKLPRNSSIWPELWEMRKPSLGWTRLSGRTSGESAPAPSQYLPPAATWSTSTVDTSVADVRCWQAGGGGRRRGCRAHPSPLASKRLPHPLCPPQPPCPACWLFPDRSCFS